MMDKAVALSVVLAGLVAVAAACGSEKRAAAPSEQPAMTVKPSAVLATDSPSPEPTPTPAEQTGTKKSSELLQLAEAGTAEGLQFALGDQTADIVEKLGEPEANDYFEGGLYLAYGNIVYFTSAGYDSDGNMTNGKVVGLGFKQGTSLYGVKVGMNFAEIEKKLGAADLRETPQDTAENAFYADLWAIVYNAGDNQLIFTAETADGPTLGAYLWGKNLPKGDEQQ